MTSSVTEQSAIAAAFLSLGTFTLAAKHPEKLTAIELTNCQMINIGRMARLDEEIIHVSRQAFLPHLKALPLEKFSQFSPDQVL